MNSLEQSPRRLHVRMVLGAEHRAPGMLGRSCIIQQRSLLRNMQFYRSCPEEYRYGGRIENPSVGYTRILNTFTPALAVKPHTMLG